MPTDPVKPSSPDHPASPCNNVCTLNDHKVCVGCKRTMAEIVAWSTMTAEEQWALARSLPKRQI